MRNEKGFSLIELLIVVAIIGIIAAIAIPNLVRSRAAANEASAISSVRTITTAEITCASTFGNGDFCALDTLVEQEFIDSALGSGSKDGYTFEVTADGNAGFTVTASPQEGMGNRTFFSDETGVIRLDNADGDPLGSGGGGGGEEAPAA